MDYYQIIIEHVEHELWIHLNMDMEGKYNPVQNYDQKTYLVLCFSNDLTLKEMVLAKNRKYGKVFMVAMS